MIISLFHNSYLPEKQNQKKILSTNKKLPNLIDNFSGVINSITAQPEHSIFCLKGTISSKHYVHFLHDWSETF